MTTTKDQLLQTAVDFALAYKRVRKPGADNRETPEYAEARMAIAALANFEGIAYNSACDLVWEAVPEQEKQLYYGYAHYSDGTVICHCVGTAQQLAESERRIRRHASAKFTRKEAEREFVLAHA